MRISDWSSDVYSSDLPPIPVVVSAIEQKYGDFDTQENSPGQTPEYEGIRLFSPGGQRLAEDNTDYRKCMSNVGNWRSMSQSLQSLDNCGVGIVYDVRRSEESRVGKECVGTCRLRWSTYQ